VWLNITMKLRRSNQNVHEIKGKKLKNPKGRCCWSTTLEFPIRASVI